MKTLFCSSHPNEDAQSFDVALQRARDQDKSSRMHFSATYAPAGEAVLLDGKWEHSILFFEEHLPALRERLRVAVRHRHAEAIHVDIGQDLTSLYLAYYAIVDAKGRYPVDVTVLSPVTFGAQHPWSKAHPLLRRRLALCVLSAARTVLVTDKETAAQLWSVFPRLDREFVGAPVSTSTGETAVAEDLPSSESP